MTLDLEALREGWDFEAKLAAGRDGKGTLPDSLWATYSAMANTHGGVVVLGVREEGDGRLAVQGLGNVDKLERDLWNLLANREKVSCNLLDRDRVERQEVQGRSAAAAGRPQQQPPALHLCAHP